jgi:hypothetical protein
VFQGQDTSTSIICWTIQMLGKNQVIQVPNPEKWKKSKYDRKQVSIHLDNNVEFVMNNI